MFDADLPEISAEELREAAKAPSTHATYLTAIRGFAPIPSKSASE